MTQENILDVASEPFISIAKLFWTLGSLGVALVVTMLWPRKYRHRP